MGFPVGYTEVFLPKFLIYVLSTLGIIRSFLFSIFNFLGLSDFLEPSDGYYVQENPTHMPVIPPLSAVLIRELLPVVKFSDLVESAGGEPPEESCAVCLYEFEGGEEIRWLKNCKHIFHRSCLDRWMDHDQKTCPLCRTPFVPRDLEEEFNQRLWAASASGSMTNTIYDFYNDDYDDNLVTISAL